MIRLARVILMTLVLTRAAVLRASHELHNLSGFDEFAESLRQVAS